MKTDIEILQNNPVFSVLSPAKLELAIQLAVAQKYAKGAVIKAAGEIWPYLFIIKKGAIRAVKYSLEGRSLVVTTFMEGDIFWGLAFFHPHHQLPVSLVAEENTRLLLWSDERLHPLLIENGQFSWELSRLMIDKMVRASEILEEMAFQPVAGRLAKLLMESSQDAVEGAIFRSLTLDEMAARIGSTREMVCRFLHRFADSNIIDITRTEYRIVDQKRLQEMISTSVKG
ncbi:MAG: hypothetical protein BGO78_10925 [Chloroflexi bacterium 44-23]|nr:MAG: hypothetical protein BGO78_10925 [Chloroflexi bacterium 44-23]